MPLSRLRQSVAAHGRARVSLAVLGALVLACISGLRAPLVSGAAPEVNLTRALAHEGSEMMMEISLAIRHRMTARELASLFHPYLTLGEAVKLAALSFGKDVNKLSCCAT